LANTAAFRAEALKVARAMAAEVAHANLATWRAAAMKSTRSREIFRSLRAEIERAGLAPEIGIIANRNANMISSLPGELARAVAKKAAGEHQRGGRSLGIESYIRMLAPDLIKSRVKLIARTEIAKAETDLTRLRAERLGIEWYEWETSRDQRVRESHKKMDSVLVAWNDPPQPEALIGEKSSAGHYHAGQVWNCRCVALPIADLSEIHWPAKVYRFGKITRMTRKEFTKIYGYQEAA
jgi:hypothetical protein